MRGLAWTSSGRKRKCIRLRVCDVMPTFLYVSMISSTPPRAGTTRDGLSTFLGYFLSVIKLKKIINKEFSKIFRECRKSSSRSKSLRKLSKFYENVFKKFTNPTEISEIFEKKFQKFNKVRLQNFF